MNSIKALFQNLSMRTQNEQQTPNMFSETMTQIVEESRAAIRADRRNNDMTLDEISRQVEAIAEDSTWSHGEKLDLIMEWRGAHMPQRIDPNFERLLDGELTVQKAAAMMAAPIESAFVDAEIAHSVSSSKKNELTDKLWLEVTEWGYNLLHATKKLSWDDDKQHEKLLEVVRILQRREHGWLFTAHQGEDLGFCIHQTQFDLPFNCNGRCGFLWMRSKLAFHTELETNAWLSYSAFLARLLESRLAPFVNVGVPIECIVDECVRNALQHGSSEKLLLSCKEASIWLIYASDLLLGIGALSKQNVKLFTFTLQSILDSKDVKWVAPLYSDNEKLADMSRKCIEMCRSYADSSEASSQINPLELVD